MMFLMNGHSRGHLLSSRNPDYLNEFMKRLLKNAMHMKLLGITPATQRRLRHGKNRSKKNLSRKQRQNVAVLNKAKNTLSY